MVERVDGGDAVRCHSATHDGSWEACDFPVTAGHSYQIRIYSWGANAGAPETYFSVAWNNYSVPGVGVPSVPRKGLIVLLSALLLVAGVLQIRRAKWRATKS